MKAAYELKERYFKIWDFTTPEEALAEYLQWQESIPEDLAKPLRIITTAWRTWSKQILAYFECPITNRFHRKLQLEDSESLPGGERVQRAKVLFSDILQKKTRKVEQVKVKKRPRFDDVPQDAMCFMMGWMTYAEPEYETRQVVRQVNLGTDLSTLLAEIDTWPTKG